MSFTRTKSLETFPGNDSATQFTTEIFARTSSQIEVSLLEDGAETMQTLGTHYTLQNIDNTANLGVVVNMITAPTANQTLKVKRTTPLEQNTDIESGGFDPEVFEQALDLIVMMIQENATAARAALRVFDPDFVTVDLPPPEAGRALMGNDDADGYVNGPNAEDIAEAQGYAEAAAVSNAEAEAWAEEDEDVEVEAGQFSAKHYAAKALAADPTLKIDKEAQAIPDDDADALDVNGFFDTNGSTTTLPSGIGSFGGLINVERTTDRGWSLYAPAGSGSEQRLFFRTKHSGGVDDWGEVLHSESTAWRMPFGGDGGHTEAGVQLTGDGFLGLTRDADVCLRINRLNLTGKQVVFETSNIERGNISADASGVDFNTSSDARLKINFRDFDAGAIVDALEFGHFDWLSGSDGYGVIAQDVYKIFPHCVTPGSEAGPGEEGFEPWGADYSKLVPVLGRDLQNVKAELKDALVELQDVRARLAALESAS